MTQLLVDQAIELMKGKHFAEALHLLRRAIDRDSSQWNAWYMAGQCYRFLNDVGGAIESLSRAAELKRDSPQIYLALGIAFQLNMQGDQAIDAFRRAIETDPDYELAYNSLALTQKKRGELENASHNYDAGAMALARRIVKAMRNSRTTPILKHRDTVGTLWLGYVMYAGLYLASSTEGINGIGWPTGQRALEEERSERHAGLYWVDTPNDKRETVRFFLPNYFNTFRQLLKRDAAYSQLVGNRGTVLELLGRRDEACAHFAEATEFLHMT